MYLFAIPTTLIISKYFENDYFVELYESLDSKSRSSKAILYLLHLGLIAIFLVGTNWFGQYIFNDGIYLIGFTAIATFLLMRKNHNRFLEYVSIFLSPKPLKEIRSSLSEESKVSPKPSQETISYVIKECKVCDSVLRVKSNVGSCKYCGSSI
jgi:hypothetical protein